jgi:hypothetical protein
VRRVGEVWLQEGFSIQPMDRIRLSTTGRTTTRLGYGCSSLMGAMGRKESIAMLEAAFEAGLRHFDVAPMYGFGQAESCVGEFLSRHKAEVTVTTKYGISAPKRQGLLSGTALAGALGGAAGGEGAAGIEAETAAGRERGCAACREGQLYGGAGEGVAGAEFEGAEDGAHRCVAAA